jgi:hypothetical protein
VLVAGFLDLSRQAAAPASRVVLPPVPSPDMPPAAVDPASPDPPAHDRPLRDPSLVYTIDSPNIVPPVVLREALPPFRGPLSSAMHGAVEVVIDEMGVVLSATLRTPVNPGYDKQIVSATLLWRYHPATLDGVPVKYRKMIDVTIVPPRW